MNMKILKQRPNPKMVPHFKIVQSSILEKNGVQAEMH